MSLINDPFSNENTPGIVGIVMGLIVFGSFLGLGVVVFDALENDIPDQEVLAANEKYILELNIETGVLERKLHGFKETKGKFAIKDEVLKSLKKEKQMLVEAQEKRDTSIQLVKDKLAEWETYREKYRANERKRAVGEVVDLSSQYDERYKKAIIKGVNDIEMKIMLSTGPKSIRYQELPSDLQDRFQFDDKQAKEVRSKMAEMERNSMKQIQAHYENKKKKEAVRGEISDQREVLADQRTRQVYLQRILENQRKIEDFKRTIDNYRSLHKSARSRGNISSHLTNANRLEVELGKLTKQNIDLENRVRMLGNK